MKNVALKIAPKNRLWKNAVKSTSRQNHVKMCEYFKSVHEVCKKIAQNIFGKFFRILVGDFPCERKKLLTLSKQKKRKIKGKESTSHNMGFARCGVESRARKIFAGWRFFPRPKFIVSCPAPREALSRYTKFYSKHCAKSSLKILGFKGQKSPCFFLESRQIFWLSNFAKRLCWKFYFQGEGSPKVCLS